MTASLLLAGKQRQPFGGPDDLVEQGSVEATRIVARWFRDLARAIEQQGWQHAPWLVERMNRQLHPGELAAAIARTAMRSQMLGALDADYEQQRDRTVKPEAFSRGPLTLRVQEKPFTLKPFQAAVDDFMGRQIVTPDVFAKMSASARARAFSIAGATKTSMVRALHEEVGRAMTELEPPGGLREFKKRLRERVELRGWLKPTGPRAEVPTRVGRPWHVETIFRNGVMSSYSRGRQRQMLQPAVREAMPYWETVTVGDKRVRASHAAMNHKVMHVDDPFWKSHGPPPWDHNCRCRVVARTPAQALKKGVEVDLQPEGLLGKGWGGMSVRHDMDERIPEPPTQVQVPVDIEPTEPKPDRYGYVPSKPKHSKAKAGVHYDRVRAPWQKTASTEKLTKQLEAVDADSRMVLEKVPLRDVIAEKTTAKRRRKILGSYQTFRQEGGPAYDWRLTINQGAKVVHGKPTSSLALASLDNAKTAGSVSEIMATGKEARQAVLTHELGHHAMERLSDTPSGKQLYSQVMAAFEGKKREIAKVVKRYRAAVTKPETMTLPVVSEYAGSCGEEWFAECYALHAHRPHLLKQLDPEGFGMVRKVLAFWQGR